MKQKHHRQLLIGLGRLVGALLILLFVGFPLYGIFLTSVLHEKDLRSRNVPFVPRNATMEHYAEVLKPNHIVPIRQAMGNSLQVSLGAATLGTLLAVPAAYAFARLPLPGKGLIMGGMASIYLLPLVLFVIPLFTVAVRLQVDDKKLTLMVLYAAFMLPFLGWVLRGFVDSIPKEVEEAGRIDGCDYPKLFRFVVLPLMRPGILAAMLFGFILSWIEFFTPLIFTSKLKILTVALGLYRSTTDIKIGQMAAAAVLTMLPVVLLTAIFQRLIARVITSGVDR